MKFSSFLILAFSMLFVACKETPSEPVEKDNEGREYYGEKIETIDPVSFEELLVQLDNQDTVVTQVKATVSSVCQKKGCWMNLVGEETGDDKSVFVKFKDYGFFMPMDIAGKQVVVRGKAYKEVTPVEELRHYAEDEGKSQEEIEAITEPVEELKFMADGVVLYKA